MILLLEDNPGDVSLINRELERWGLQYNLKHVRDKDTFVRTLKEREKLFSAAVNNIPDTFIIYDAQRKIRFINEKGIRISGMNLTDILGKTDVEIYPLQVNDRYLPALKRAIETKG